MERLLTCLLVGGIVLFGSARVSAAELARPGQGADFVPLDPETERLVGRAPLENPNLAVHVVEPRQFSDVLRHEIVLYPAAAQINGRFTQHIGTALSYLFHINDTFAIHVSPQYNWLAQPNAFSRELIDKASVDAIAASSLLLQWSAQAGVEVTPIVGKFTLHNRTLGRFAFVINAGAGAGGTQHELRPGNAGGPATFGDTGIRFTGSIGAGFRIELPKGFTIRLEVRDVVLTARADRINGCNAADLGALIDARVAGEALSTAGVTGACRVASFDGTDAFGRERADDLFTARDLVLRPTSDVLNLVTVFAGFSVVF